MRNEADVTREMLKRINEAAENAGLQEIIITDDSKFGQKTLSSEKDYFVNGIGSSVKFGYKPLVYYPDRNDLTFSGEIVDMNNLRFQYRLNDPSGEGCYIWVQGLQMSETNTKKVQLIHNLFLNWKERWIRNGKLLDSFKS